MAPRFLPRLALAAASLLVALLLAEGLVRVVGAAPEVVLIEEGRFRLSPNPRLGYEPVPHPVSHDSHLTSFYDYVGTSNARGFRDVDHDLAKPPGVTRVVILGDSVAAGMGLQRLEETLPRQLETALEDAGAPVEVVSLAVSGYDTGQEVAMLADRGLAYDPDWVLVAYCLNDSGRSDGGILNALRQRAEAQDASGRLPAHRYHPLFAKSALYRLAVHRLEAAEGDEGSDTVGDEVEAAAGEPSGPPDSRPAALDELAALSEAHGFRTLLVIYPQMRRLLDYPAHVRAQHREVREMATERGIPVADLLPAFQECRRETTEPLAFNRFHPNAAGHACGARAVAEALIRQGL